MRDDYRNGVAGTVRVPVELLSDEERIEIERRIRLERMMIAEEKRRRYGQGHGSSSGTNGSMTLREAMKVSAQLTMEQKQQSDSRQLPQGAIRCSSAAHSECNNNNVDANDDFIFPRATITPANTMQSGHM